MRDTIYAEAVNAFRSHDDDKGWWQGEYWGKHMLGAGVPTFGDSRALFGLDKVQTFVGKLGDLAIDISYALPRYERRGEDYRLVRRGAVVLTILQSPMITPGKTLLSK